MERGFYRCIVSWRFGWVQWGTGPGGTQPSDLSSTVPPFKVVSAPVCAKGHPNCVFSTLASSTVFSLTSLQRFLDLRPYSTTICFRTPIPSKATMAYLYYICRVYSYLLVPQPYVGSWLPVYK